jgi:hypothetical protein
MATIASAAVDRPASASWYARRAKLMQTATEHAASASTFYAALYVRKHPTSW